MTPHDSLPNPDNRLLQRYREANAHDAARPAPALRETVLAHARAAAAARAETPAPARRPAANDSAWTWRAFGGLAVIGLAGLLVLQFERGAPEEKEAALGTTGVSRPAVQPAPAPMAKAAAAPPRNATEGLSRERRESTVEGPAAATAPLLGAIAAGDLNAVRQGLREGADPNQRGTDGETPLMAAARRGNDAIVRLLLDAGADRTLRDPQGLSAADHAERAGHDALLPLLR
jgi:Ankyrin repeats (many copies)